MSAAADGKKRLLTNEFIGPLLRIARKQDQIHTGGQARGIHGVYAIYQFSAFYHFAGHVHDGIGKITGACNDQLIGMDEGSG